MIKDYNGLLVLKDNNLKLSGTSNILILNNYENLNIILDDDANIKLNFFSDKINGNYNLNITQNKNSKITIITSFITSLKFNYNIENTITGNNNEFILKVRGHAKADTKIVMLSKVIEDTINNEVLQDAKIIKENCSVIIEPNVEVSTNEVIANHMVTIYDADDDEVFYLKSKGLSLAESKELIKNGLLYGVFDDTIRTLIKKEINE